MYEITEQYITQAVNFIIGENYDKCNTQSQLNAGAYKNTDKSGRNISSNMAVHRPGKYQRNSTENK